MASLLILIGGLVMAGGLAWMGVQGLRGVPDSSGKTTSKPVAIVCLVLAGLLAVGTVAVVVWLELS